MFEKRKQRKAAERRVKETTRAAERRFKEAIAAEWERRGVRPADSSGPAFRRAAAEAGVDYITANEEVIVAAKDRLSPEDRYVVTGGSEGRDPFRTES